MIDVHAHVFFEALLGRAGTYGPLVETTPAGCHLVTGELRWPLASSSALTTEPGDRVAALDDAGIDLQVITMSPLWLFHHAPADVAEPFARMANDILAAWCGRTGGRVRPLAQLPTQNPGSAASELRRCVEQLGMLGGYIGTDARPDLDDHDLDELYSACEELGVPLFIHSTVPGADGPAGDVRLDRWLGHVVLGYPIEETIAVRSLLLGDVLPRHPRLDICVSHGGGAIPFLWGRLKAYARTPASPVSPQALQERMHRLWFDTHLHSDSSVRLLREIANPGRLVFGSNFGGWDSELFEPSQAAETEKNARRLLRL